MCVVLCVVCACVYGGCERVGLSGDCVCVWCVWLCDCVWFSVCIVVCAAVWLRVCGYVCVCERHMIVLVVVCVWFCVYVVVCVWFYTCECVCVSYVCVGLWGGLCVWLCGSVCVDMLCV